MSLKPILRVDAAGSPTLMTCYGMGDGMTLAVSDRVDHVSVGIYLTRDDMRALQRTLQVRLDELDRLDRRERALAVFAEHA